MADHAAGLNGQIVHIIHPTNGPLRLRCDRWAQYRRIQKGPSRTNNRFQVISEPNGVRLWSCDPRPEADGNLSLGSEGVRLERNHAYGDELLRIVPRGNKFSIEEIAHGRVLSIGSEGICTRKAGHVRGDELLVIVVE